ncbi:hypothetical protein SAMN04488589_0624 [Methanolobus vulcani]|uniref:Uncharacterized protein n=1 Tax=Methanolobus vulcani TaxID=38026 RepID=A0A7Z7AUY4_9EURY|nr:hypothetical protein [Methanolobus vulcani]SDF47225.1 hypothetical protein SAMN04488589_0624 [Methanolobus vulcani]
MVRAKVPASEKKIGMCVSIHPKLYDRIDEIRGDMPRSAYISDVLEQHLVDKQVGY